MEKGNLDFRYGSTVLSTHSVSGQQCNVTEEVMNRDLTSVGTFDVFVPAHVAPRMSATQNTIN